MFDGTILLCSGYSKHNGMSRNKIKIHELLFQEISVVFWPMIHKFSDYEYPYWKFKKKKSLSPSPGIVKFDQFRKYLVTDEFLWTY